MDPSDWNRVNGMLADCAISLLSAFGTPVKFDPAGDALHPPQDGVLAIIGFPGDRMRGSLVLCANRGILERSHPVRGAAVPFDLGTLQDWAGELANQLLGRLKSRLLAHGISIRLGTPATVSGLELRVRSGSGPSLPIWLGCGSDWLVVRLDALVAADTTLSDSPDPSSAATEGETLLF